MNKENFAFTVNLLDFNSDEEKKDLSTMVVPMFYSTVVPYGPIKDTKVTWYDAIPCSEWNPEAYEKNNFK